MRDLYRYIWKVSGRQQLVLSALAIGLFAVELAPLELQRRIVNDAVAHRDFRFIAVLCLVYAGVALAHGALKFALNVYRSTVGEAATRRLRMHVHAPTGTPPDHEGVAVSIVVSEVEVVGGFIASSFSVPVLNAGILLSVLGYMVYTQPWLALVAVLLFCPQVLFIPLLQAAINRRSEARIKVLRALSVNIVDGAAGGAYVAGVKEGYRLNLQIFRRKFGMNFLMNFMYQLGVVGILSVGSWLFLEGRTEVGTIVAFISGLNRMNDPWGDLVDFFRDLTNAAVRFRLIAPAIGEAPA